MGNIRNEISYTYFYLDTSIYTRAGSRGTFALFCCYKMTFLVPCKICLNLSNVYTYSCSDCCPVNILWHIMAYSTIWLMYLSKGALKNANRTIIWVFPQQIILSKFKCLWLIGFFYRTIRKEKKNITRLLSQDISYVLHHFQHYKK